jgi:hypothetical protein
LFLTLYGKPDAILQYYRSLEQNIDKKNYSVLLPGDLNGSSFDWERGLVLSNCYFYLQLKSVAIYTTTYLSLSCFYLSIVKTNPFRPRTTRCAADSLSNLL